MHNCWLKSKWFSQKRNLKRVFCYQNGIESIQFLFKVRSFCVIISIDLFSSNSAHIVHSNTHTQMHPQNVCAYGTPNNRTIWIQNAIESYWDHYLYYYSIFFFVSSCVCVQHKSHLKSSIKKRKLSACASPLCCLAVLSFVSNQYFINFWLRLPFSLFFFL